MTMKLVILTKSTFFVEEDNILATLFNEGMVNLHVYKPGASSLYLERLLSLLPEEHHSKITIHNHYHLKNEFHLAGIHIDNDKATYPSGYKGSIGRSCTDLTTLKKLKKKSDYVFLGNIFDSIEFKEKKSNFNIKQLEEASYQGLIDKHVFAFGGMNIEHAKIVRQLGFGGIVICGDLWQHFDIHRQTDFKTILTHFEKLHKTIS